LQNNSSIPLFISVDEEGGSVTRLSDKPETEVDELPFMQTLGEINDPKKTYSLSKNLGTQLNSLGFNLDFAPVADINSNPNNPVIGNRSFGDTPEIVSKMIPEVIKGLQSSNVSACLKHFPGHGDTSDDTHDGRVTLDVERERLDSLELIPFSAGIKSDVDFVMVSHISLPKITNDDMPATFSKEIVTDILRSDLNFEKIIITDALDMQAITSYYSSEETAVNCINAGIDIILMPEQLDEAFAAIEKAINDKTINESVIDKSLRRIIKVKLERNIIK
jgi:Beta-glucosidase-related glycosidases